MQKKKEKKLNWFEKSWTIKISLIPASSWGELCVQDDGSASVQCPPPFWLSCLSFVSCAWFPLMRCLKSSLEAWCKMLNVYFSSQCVWRQPCSLCCFGCTEGEQGCLGRRPSWKRRFDAASARLLLRWEKCGSHQVLHVASPCRSSSKP